MANIILGYKIMSCWGYELSPGGWSFDLYGEGTIRFRTYLKNGNVTSSKRMTIPLSASDEIRRKLELKQSIIDGLPTKTNNRSCDGAYHTFNFLGKKITSLNISKHSEERLKSEVENGLIESEYAMVLKNENTIIDVFASVAHILKPYGMQAIFDPDYFTCEWDGINPWSKNE